MTDLRWCCGIRTLGIPGHYTSVDNFYMIGPRAGRKARLDSFCKDCNKARVKAWRQANPDKVSQYNAAWYYSDLEEHRRISRERNRMLRGKGHHVWKRYRNEDHRSVRLAVGPFHEWLKVHVVPLLASKEEIAKATAERRGAEEGLFTWTNIAIWVDWDPKSITNYTSGKTKTVPRELVDRIGLVFGHMDLSDELYGEADVVS